MTMSRVRTSNAPRFRDVEAFHLDAMPDPGGPCYVPHRTPRRAGWRYWLVWASGIPSALAGPFETREAAMLEGRLDLESKNKSR